MRRVCVVARRLLVACVVAGFGVGLGPPRAESNPTARLPGSDRLVVADARTTEFLATSRTGGSVREGLNWSILPLGETISAWTTVESERPGASIPLGLARGAAPDVGEEHSRLCIWLI